MKENWKPIVYNGIEYKNYQVSNLGRVKNLRINKILKGLTKHRTKDFMTLSLNGIRQTAQIQILVWEAFNGVVKEGYRVEHIKGFKNHLDNLQLIYDIKISIKDTGFPQGISLTANKQKFCAQIPIPNIEDGKRSVYLGSYRLEEHAVHAYGLALNFAKSKSTPTREEIRELINKYRTELNLVLLPQIRPKKKTKNPVKFKHITLEELNF